MTPGPWSYRSQPHDDWGIVRAGRYIICQARDPDVRDDQLNDHRRVGTDPYEDNARLIASAPDMLKALQTIGQYVDQVDMTPKLAAHNMADAFRLYAAPLLAALEARRDP